MGNITATGKITSGDFTNSGNVDIKNYGTLVFTDASGNTMATIDHNSPYLTLQNLTAYINISDSLVPNSNNVYSLGTSTFKWNSLWATNLNGTITTSSQPNITSVGTLTKSNNYRIRYRFII